MQSGVVSALWPGWQCHDALLSLPHCIAMYRNPAGIGKLGGNGYCTTQARFELERPVIGSPN